MHERKYISADTYIEYDIDNNNQINRTSLHVVNNNQVISILSTGIYQGILATLIENEKKEIEDTNSVNICISAWPLEYDFDSSFDFERNLRDRIGAIRKQFALLIGDKASKNLLPRKIPGFGYKIVFPTISTTSQLSNDAQKTSDIISFKTLTQLNSLGLSNLDVAKQITANDIANFGFPEHSIQEGSSRKWKEFMDEEPTGWGFLFDENTKSIVGNYSSVIISKTQREMLFSGTLHDGLLDLDHTVSFDTGRDHTLYILNISVNPTHNTPQNRKLLFDNFFNMILELAKQKIFFKEIFFTSWRFRKPLLSYGFTYKNDIPKDDGSLIMAIEEFPNQLIWEHSNELKKLYDI